MKRLEPLKNQLPEICRVIHTSWEHDLVSDGYFRYTPDYLELLLDPGNEHRTVIVGAFDSGRLVGVNAALPRNILLNGDRIPAAVSALMSVLPDHRDTDLGKQMLTTTAKMLAEQGISQNLIYLEPGRFLADTYHSTAGLKMAKIFKSRWLIKLLQPNEMSFGMDMNTVLKGYFGENMQLHFFHDKRRCMGAKTFRFIGNTLNIFFKPRKEALEIMADIRKYGKGRTAEDRVILDGIFDRLYSFSNRYRLARIWSKPELERQLNSDYSHTIVLTGKNGEVKGFINFIKTRIRFKKIFKFAWMDIIFVDGLKEQEIQALLFASAREAIKYGCVAMIAPYMRYFNELDLYKNGFGPFTRNFQLWLTTTGGLKQTGPLKKCFIGVL